MTSEKKYAPALTDLRAMWVRKNIDIELGIMNGERPTDNIHTEIKNWGLSTPSKRKFLLNIIRATLDNCHITVPELVTLGVAERQTILGYIKECEDAGWIKVCREENKNKITATAILLKHYGDYCAWLVGAYYTSNMLHITHGISVLKHLDSYK